MTSGSSSRRNSRALFWLNPVAALPTYTVEPMN
jgi:hypothetical protein